MSLLVCSVRECGKPARHQLYHNDYYDYDGPYYQALEGEALCSSHALRNEIGASGDLPLPRCCRHYPFVDRLGGGWITYRLLSTDDPLAKRAAKLLPKKPKGPWWAGLPRPVEAMKELLEKLEEMEGGAQ